VTLAVVAPSLVPAGAALPAPGWLASGAVQSVSQFALLVVIIGASGRLRDYGIRKPGAGDVLRAAVLSGALALVSRAAASAAAIAGWSVGAGWGAATFIPLPTNAPPAAIVTLCALFSVAVAYREELFYRIYVMGALGERGAGTAAAIAVSTALFAAGHAYQGPAGILSSTLAGLLMAGAAARGFRLHALAWAHAAYDFFVLVTAFGLWPVELRG